MGMFDNITCDWPLPVPTSDDELLNKFPVLANPIQMHFQTKDLGCTMNTFVITNEGRLVVMTSNHFKKHVNSTNVENFSGTINFYDSVISDEMFKPEYDKSGWLEYQAIFSNGIIQSVKIVNFEPPSNFTEDEHREIKATKDRIKNLHEQSLEKGFNKLNQYRTAIRECYRAIETLDELAKNECLNNVKDDEWFCEYIHNLTNKDEGSKYYNLVVEKLKPNIKPVY